MHGEELVHSCQCLDRPGRVAEREREWGADCEGEGLRLVRWVGEAGRVIGRAGRDERWGQAVRFWEEASRESVCEAEEKRKREKRLKGEREGVVKERRPEGFEYASVLREWCECEAIWEIETIGETTTEFGIVS
jgi:hypothetical protein